MTTLTPDARRHLENIPGPGLVLTADEFAALRALVADYDRVTAEMYRLAAQAILLTNPSSGRVAKLRSNGSGA